jgi:hypothetical protein
VARATSALGLSWRALAGHPSDCHSSWSPLLSVRALLRELPPVRPIHHPAIRTRARIACLGCVLRSGRVTRWATACNASSAWLSLSVAGRQEYPKVMAV